MTPEELIQELRGDHAGVKPGVDRMPANLPLAMELCDAYEALRAELADCREKSVVGINALAKQNAELVDENSKLRAEVERLYARLAITEVERDALRKRISEAPKAWAGQHHGEWAAETDFRDPAQVRSILSGWGTPEEQAAIHVMRVALVKLEDGE